MGDRYTRGDVLRSFRGLVGYRFQSKDYCPSCAKGLDFGEGPWTWEELHDGERVPQPLVAARVEEGAACSQCESVLAGAAPDDEVAGTP